MASGGDLNGEEDVPILIVGSGICGLATALALHRKGLKSVVVERSDTLRSAGGAIGILANGWLALDQLGISQQLRLPALLIQGGKDVWIDNGKQERFQFLKGEARWMKRSDLIHALADALPPGTLRFGCEIQSVDMDPQLMRPIVHLTTGKSIRTKVLIGCDGSKSIIGDYLGVRPTRMYSLSAVRGLTNYPDGHQLPIEFLRLRKNGILFGRIPVDYNLVYWFVAQPKSRHGGRFTDDPEQIKQLTLKTITGFPPEMVELVERSNLDSLTLTRLRYRAPWDLLFGRFCKGPITVAGDAMHVMCPFLTQGGSAGLEDAVVLARNLAPKMKLYCSKDIYVKDHEGVAEDIAKALQKFIDERRMRVVRLSTETFLTGIILETKYAVVKFFVTLFMVMLFRDLSGHSKYNCGQL